MTTIMPKLPATRSTQDEEQPDVEKVLTIGASGIDTLDTDMHGNATVDAPSKTLEARRKALLEDMETVRSQ
jgi:hypothetical protein